MEQDVAGTVELRAVREGQPGVDEGKHPIRPRELRRRPGLPRGPGMGRPEHRRDLAVERGRVHGGEGLRQLVDPRPGPVVDHAPTGDETHHQSGVTEPGALDVESDRLGRRHRGALREPEPVELAGQRPDRRPTDSLDHAPPARIEPDRVGRGIDPTGQPPDVDDLGPAARQLPCHGRQPLRRRLRRVESQPLVPPHDDSQPGRRMRRPSQLAVATPIPGSVSRGRGRGRGRGVPCWRGAWRGGSPAGRPPRRVVLRPWRRRARG